jgi:hypothetical protein
MAQVIEIAGARRYMPLETLAGITSSLVRNLIPSAKG